jgi:hypothetical protein
MRSVRSVALIALAGCLPPFLQAAPESCSFTKAPDHIFVPPPPYAALPPEGTFYFGSDDLWLRLPNDGVWATRKIFWYSKEYWWLSEPKPDLVVDAKRLDGSAPPVHTVDATNGFTRGNQNSFMLNSIEFPATGCWEISARYHNHELNFVVWVSP